MSTNYLEIYSQLPEEIRQKASAAGKMAQLKEVESKFEVELTGYVIRLLIKDIRPGDLANFLIKEQGLSLEKAMAIKHELVDKIYKDVLADLVRVEASAVEPDLIRKYNTFVRSSLFSNILASQEQASLKYNQANENELKDEFYGAINAGDRVKLISILRLVCEKIGLRKFFEADERYEDFFGGVLERHSGVSARDEFEKDVAAKNYIIQFLKFILEKRLNFSNEDSAMIGTGLSSLCQQANEDEYSKMAYGDESKKQFVWNN